MMAFDPLVVTITSVVYIFVMFNHSASYNLYWLVIVISTPLSPLKRSSSYGAGT